MTRTHRAALFVLTAVVAFVGLGVASDLRRELGGDYESQLFYGALYGQLLDDYRGVAVVAHNVGNQPSAIESAQITSVPIIEIDVRTISGQLYAAHSAPTPIVGHYFSSAVPLATAWSRAADAPAIKLDLKDSSSAFLRRLVTFLELRPDDGPRLIISSRSLPALANLRQELPDATLLLSVATLSGLEGAQSDESLTETIDGVSVYTSLLAEDDVALLKQNGLLIYVWTVNYLEDLNRLVQWGVDAVTTDNLAIMELLAPNIEEDLELADEELDEA